MPGKPMHVISFAAERALADRQCTTMPMRMHFV